MMLSVGSIFARGVVCSLSLSAVLVQAAVGSDAQAILCEDGAHATLEHTTVHMGKYMRRWTCGTAVNSTDMAKLQRVEDFDLCTADCTTYCDEPSLENNIDQDDCYALAKYYATAGRFTIDAHKYIIWEYDTCRVTQYNRLNHADQKISYCFDQHHWAGVIDYVSSYCGSKPLNAQRGTCYFYDSLHFSSITVEKA